MWSPHGTGTEFKKKLNQENLQGALVPLVAVPGHTSKKHEFLEFKLDQFLAISPQILGLRMQYLVTIQSIFSQSCSIIAQILDEHLQM